MHWHAKSHFIPSIHFWETVNFRLLWPGWPHPFLTMTNFWSTFNLCEFVSTCKKSGYFIDLFWRYGWLKNPAIWLAENILAHISGTKILNTANNINFHYRTNSEKINDKMFQYIPKSQCFGPFLVHLPNFWSKKDFSGKSIFVTHNFKWVSSTMPKFRKKIMIQFQENAWTDGRTEGWADCIS